MNFTQLSEAIQAYAETTEQLFVDNIPNFVQLAEERIYNAVQIPAIRKNVIGNFTAGDHYLALPDDYLASFSLAVIDSSGNYEYLLDKDVNFIREAYPNPQGEVHSEGNNLDDVRISLGNMTKGYKGNNPYGVKEMRGYGAATKGRKISGKQG